MDTTVDLLTTKLPDSVTAAELLATATLDAPVTMPTEPDAHTARHLVRGPANTAATLARNTRNVELLEQLAKHRSTYVQREVATNPATPVTTRVTVIRKIVGRLNDPNNKQAVLDAIILHKNLDTALLCELLANWTGGHDTGIIELISGALTHDLVAQHGPTHAYMCINNHVRPEHRDTAIATYCRWFQVHGSNSDEHPNIEAVVNTLTGNDAAVGYPILIEPSRRLNAAVLDGAHRHSRTLLTTLCEHANGFTDSGIEWLRTHPDVIDIIIDVNPYNALDVADQLTPDQLVAVLNTTAASGRRNATINRARFPNVEQQRVVATYQKALDNGHTPTEFEYIELEALCDAETGTLLETLVTPNHDDIVDRIVTGHEHWGTGDINHLERCLTKQPDLVVDIAERHSGTKLNGGVTAAATHVANNHPEHTSTLCQAIPDIVKQLEPPAAAQYLGTLRDETAAGRYPTIDNSHYLTLVATAARHPDISRELLGWGLWHGTWKLTLQLAANPDTCHSTRDALTTLGDNTGHTYNGITHTGNGPNDSLFDPARPLEQQRGAPNALMHLHKHMRTNGIDDNVIRDIVDTEIDRCETTCEVLHVTSVGRRYITERFARTFAGNGTAWRTALSLSQTSPKVTPATIERSTRKLVGHHTNDNHIR